MIHEGDKVRSNGKYRDINAKFGDTVHTVVAVGEIPSCKKPIIWLDCGGGWFMADGFDAVDAKKGGVLNEQETRSDEARGRAHGRNRQARAALVKLTRPTTSDLHALLDLAKFAIDHSMYGGCVLQALVDAVIEGKRVLEEEGGAS